MDKEKNKFVYGILVGLLIGALCFSIVYLVTKDKKGKVSGNSAATEEQSGNSLDDTTVVDINGNKYSLSNYIK